MARRTVALAITLATILAALSVAPAAAVAPPLPSSMAAVGDSITQAASTLGGLGTDSPQNSWSTGTSATVNSHYLRLLALNPAISGQNFNLSVSGAKMVNLVGQMERAAALRPQYLTVLMGGNDICTSTEAAMTEVGAFRDQFIAGMAALRLTSPETQVYVVSIPRVMGLYELFKGNFWARFIWAIAGICQSLLASPTSTNQGDIDRRARVAQRNADFNAVLAEVCAAPASQPCRTDGGAVYNTSFAASDVSGDYFHPSTAGQAKLAAVTWARGYWANQAPVASLTSACTGLTCEFSDTSTDADGTIVSRTWSFGDGATSSDASPSHTYAAAGTYSISLTVTDDDGATASTTGTVTVAPAAAPAMWVESLTPTTATDRRTWSATVTVLVVDTNGRPVVGATVAGTWSVGPAGTCTTGELGTCSVTSDALQLRKVPAVSFTVAGLTHATFEWDDTQGQMTVEVTRPA